MISCMKYYINCNIIKNNWEGKLEKLKHFVGKVLMLTLLFKNCSSYWGLSYCIYLKNITIFIDINLGMGAKDFNQTVEMILNIS